MRSSAQARRRWRRKKKISEFDLKFDVHYTRAGRMNILFYLSVSFTTFTARWLIPAQNNFRELTRATRPRPGLGWDAKHVPAGSLKLWKKTLANVVRVFGTRAEICSQNTLFSILHNSGTKIVLKLCCKIKFFNVDTYHFRKMVNNPLKICCIEVQPYTNE